MSTDSSFETFPQFGDCQDAHQAIPPISSFAKRNTQIPTSPVSEQYPQPAGFYRELTVEELDSDDPMPRSSRVTTSHHVMEPRSHQHYDKPASAVYQMPSQMINSMAAVTNMAPVSTAASAMTHNGSLPTTPGAEMMSPPLHVANSSLLAQALQVGNDMAGLHQQLQQQQQQLLQAMHTAQAQYDGQKMMTSPTCSDQSLNSQETSPNMNPTDHRHAKAALACFPSHAVPVSIQCIDPINVLTMGQSTQLHPQSHSRIPTPPIMADNAYNMTSSTDSESSPGMLATMTMPGSYMQPQPMAMSHQMFVPSPEAASPEMIASDESMLDQMASGITNNNDDELMSNNMPVQCQQTSNSKRRNRKKPVPNEDKDEKYFERRDRNNLAAKRSRDSRKKREDHVSLRANFLQKENDILRAQLATLRQEANSLRQLLSQQRPIATPHMPMQMSMQMFPNTKTMGP